MWIFLWVINILVLYLVILFAINNSDLRYLKGWLEQMNETILDIESRVRKIEVHLMGEEKEVPEMESGTGNVDIDTNTEDMCPGCGCKVSLDIKVCPDCELKLSD